VSNIKILYCNESRMSHTQMICSESYFFYTKAMSWIGVSCKMCVILDRFKPKLNPLGKI